MQVLMDRRERLGSKQNGFLDKALKMTLRMVIPWKYKIDIFWMDAEMQKAAELYLLSKE